MRHAKDRREKRPRRSAISRKSVFLGGSSRFFRMAFAALRIHSSAVSTITTRQPASPAVLPRNGMMRRTVFNGSSVK